MKREQKGGEKGLDEATVDRGEGEKKVEQRIVRVWKRIRMKREQKGGEKGLDEATVDRGEGEKKVEQRIDRCGKG